MCLSQECPVWDLNVLTEGDQIMFGEPGMAVTLGGIARAISSIKVWQFCASMISWM